MVSVSQRIRRTKSHVNPLIDVLFEIDVDLHCHNEMWFLTVTRQEEQGLFVIDVVFCCLENFFY